MSILARLRNPFERSGPFAAETSPDLADHLKTELAAMHAENATLKARIVELEAVADTDALLPVYNRRAFVRELNRQIGLCRRHNTPASLLFFDLVGFKQINDTLGHATGDAALHGFVETLRANLRETDVIGRLGGDEFGVILSNAALEAGILKAHRLIAAVIDNPLQRDGIVIPLGASFGIAPIDPDRSAEALIDQADEAMYASRALAASQREAAPPVT